LVQDNHTNRQKDLQNSKNAGFFYETKKCQHTKKIYKTQFGKSNQKLYNEKAFTFAYLMKFNIKD